MKRMRWLLVLSGFITILLSSVLYAQPIKVKKATIVTPMNEVIYVNEGRYLSNDDYLAIASAIKTLEYKVSVVEEQRDKWKLACESIKDKTDVMYKLSKDVFDKYEMKIKKLNDEIYILENDRSHFIKENDKMNRKIHNLKTITMCEGIFILVLAFI